MRVTNQMSMNRMLLNINRNARRTDFLYQQMSSGKRIQVPSDNPIVASRALKFRTNISETEQFRRNVNQAQAWMRTTEEGFKNSLDLTARIRELLVQGATDSLEDSDRKKIVDEIRMLTEQLGGEMNVTYTGRHVFSGFRTDMPPVITQDNNYVSHDINQRFALSDIQRTTAFAKDDPSLPPTIHNIQKIDLPYRGNDRIIFSDGFGAANINVYSAAGVPTNLVMALEGATPPVTPTVTVLQPPPPAGTGNAADWAGRYVPAPNAIHIIPETGEMVFGSDVAAALRQVPEARGGLSIDYTLNGVREGELNPVLYFNTTRFNLDTNGDRMDNPPHSPRVFTMDNQQLRFEFGVNTRVQINNLAKNVLTATLHAELVNFANMISDESIQFSSDAHMRDRWTPYWTNILSEPPYELEGDDLTEAVETRVADSMTNQRIEERNRYRQFLSETFDNMIGRISHHQAQILREDTNLGARLTRVDITTERLRNNELTFTELKSENENIDYLEVIMLMNNMEAVLQASMMAGTRINQMTLADFIR